MTLIILVIVFVSALLALGLALWHQEKQRQWHILRYLETSQETSLEKLSKLVVRIGQEKREELEQQFIDAGIYNTRFARFYVPAKIAFALLIILLIVISDMTLSSKVTVGAISMVAALILPDIILSMRKKMLIKKTSRQLPYMLDMMSVCVSTGMTVETALAYLAEELKAFDKDLCFHIKKTADSSRITGLEKALLELSERIPTAEVRSFSLTLIQNIHYGTSIANVLSDLAEDMRKMQVLSMEESIGKLAAKMSVPLIILIMFPIVILILAPGFMQLSLSIG
ncbi:type II secretion system F family protein [Shewanella psychropiezotolerans]|uniref:Type II secretion system F family protein n=1 Tax=Shewanella psychropiezotolerans TaxID=2593655 RepID=A0ABX5X382_9GAMM|nr:MULTISPECIES: type II secretion system F family protein [Shewanella]MPY26138.1 type II secretion system F family protein [Shewanella sp. YLB-07]QDO85809.1 type II secretion system F family protein [Shewanella psychropiezotolerans]